MAQVENLNSLNFHSFKILHSIAATANDGDFHPLSNHLTFSPGSGNGAQLCSSVTILPDNVTETEETFSVILKLVGDVDSIRLGNNVTRVVHTDDDGTYVHVTMYEFR